jgi:MoxR-like ATPase
MVDKVSKKELQRHHKHLEGIKKEVGKVIVGQHGVINCLLRSLLANGHVFVEGVPGIAKTLLIKTLAQVTGCKFNRIQFTVDLLPTDITGITSYNEKKGFYVVKGPIFSNFVIADEINRAPAKTQSALLESMAERQVTIGKRTFKLEEPFFVMATQNPIETTGTYPLPEAQVDRFLFKVMMDYPSIDEEEEVLGKNINLRNFEDFGIKSVTSPKEILAMQRFVKKIYLKDNIRRYIVAIVEATRDPKKYGIKLGRYVEWGASPRASIGLFIGAKTEALLNNRAFVTPQHVKDVAYDVLRHRLLLNYEGQAEQIKSDDIITEILSKVPVP